MSITALKGIGFTAEVQKTLGSAKTISGITLANPGVVTSTSHGFSNGDVVILAIAGMVQLNQVACRVANVTTNTFELEGIDTSGYTAFTSGSATKVTAWDTIGWATSLNLAGSTPKEIDTTTLADTQLQVAYGMSAAGSGTIDGFDQVADTAMLNLKAASTAQATRAFRLSYASGQKRIFNANVSAGGGFSVSVNEAGKMSAALTVRGFINEYSS